MLNALHALTLIIAIFLAAYAVQTSRREVLVVMRPYVLPMPIVGTGAPGAAAPRGDGCATHAAMLGVPVDEQPAGGERITRVAAAAERCTIAVARGDVVLVSDDDGRSSYRTLGVPGALRDLAVTADGTVFVWRTPDRLGVRDPDGRERWTTLPAAASALAVSGRWLGVVTTRHLILSDDGARGWVWLALPEETDPDEGAALAFHVAGETVLVARDQGIDRGSLDGAPWRRVWTAPPERLERFAFGGDGWLYGFTRVDDAERLTVLAVSQSGKERIVPLAGVSDTAAWPHHVAAAAGGALVHLADTFSRLERGRVTSTLFAGEGCAGPAEQSSWPLFTMHGVDRHGLALAVRRDAPGALVRVPGCMRERAILP